MDECPSLDGLVGNAIECLERAMEIRRLSPRPDLNAGLELSLKITKAAKLCHCARPMGRLQVSMVILDWDAVR